MSEESEKETSLNIESEKKIYSLGSLGSIEIVDLDFYSGPGGELYEVQANWIF